jgi:fatty acid desaturase
VSAVLLIFLTALLLLTGLLLAALLLLAGLLLTALLLTALPLLARFLVGILIHYSVLSNIDPKRHFDRSRPDRRQCAAEIFVPMQPTLNFEENVFGTAPPRDGFPKYNKED